MRREQPHRAVHTAGAVVNGKAYRVNCGLATFSVASPPAATHHRIPIISIVPGLGG